MSDSYTKLLLHCNGADAATSFVDSALTKTVTANGTAQLDTAQKKFGSASGLFDGDSDYLSLADSADWNLSNGAFTIDFWARWAALPANGVHMGFVTHFTDVNNRWIFFMANDGGTYNLKFYAAPTYVDAGEAMTLSIDTWYHLAVVRSGDSWYFFLNGTQLGTTITDNRTLGDFTDFIIGKDFSTSGYFNGWIDEFRVSKGIARWTANFTPPTQEYDILVTVNYLKQYRRSRFPGSITGI